MAFRELYRTDNIFFLKQEGGLGSPRRLLHAVKMYIQHVYVVRYLGGNC